MIHRPLNYFLKTQRLDGFALFSLGYLRIKVILQAVYQVLGIDTTFLEDDLMILNRESWQAIPLDLPPGSRHLQWDSP